MKLSVIEYEDLSNLYKLETLLKTNISIQRLNLPSRDKLLSEIEIEISKLKELEKIRGNQKEEISEFSSFMYRKWKEE